MEKVRRKSLANRIFAALFVLSFGAMLAATIAATAASYTSYEKDAEDYLLNQAQDFAQLLQDEPDADAICALAQDFPLADTRTTLVAADGTVLYDSYTDASNLDNHANREEIIQAKQSGQGILMRHSETLGTDTLYAAVEVDDGVVLRLAETRTSLVSFLGGASQRLFVSFVLIFILSALVSRLLTAMVVRPLREIDLAHPLANDAYEELQPLLRRVDDQRRELEGQRDDLEYANSIRREFTGNVSHEMKTPLQVIGGYAELMEGGIVSAEDVPHFAGLIRTEAETMRLLIDDVLVLSRLDEKAGGDEPVSISQTCDRVVGRLASTAEAKNVSLDCDCGGENQLIVSGDPSMAEQMIYNLVENAIKYGPEGGCVRIRAKAVDDVCQLSVSDEGSGIPDESKERVFERFFRVDVSRSRETGGTGLGLAIVKHAAETFGGSVWVEDAPGGGALFKVSIPLRKADQEDRCVM